MGSTKRVSVLDAEGALQGENRHQAIRINPALSATLSAVAVDKSLRS